MSYEKLIVLASADIHTIWKTFTCEHFVAKRIRNKFINKRKSVKFQKTETTIMESAEQTEEENQTEISTRRKGKDSSAQRITLDLLPIQLLDN